MQMLGDAKQEMMCLESSSRTNIEYYVNLNAFFIKREFKGQIYVILII